MIGERRLLARAGILAALAGDRVPPSHNARGWLRACRSLAALAGFAYLLLLAWVYHHQERLIFRPAPLPATQRFALAHVHEVAIPVAGATLSALHLRLPNPRGLIFFLHGNSGVTDRYVELYERLTGERLVAAPTSDINGRIQAALATYLAG